MIAPAADLQPLLTIAEVAALLRMSRRFVRDEVSRGRLAVVRLGRSPRFTPAAVQAYIDRQTMQPRCSTPAGVERPGSPAPLLLPRGREVEPATGAAGRGRWTEAELAEFRHGLLSL